MKFKNLLIILIFIISGGICFCQDNFTGNLYLIDKLMDENFTSLNNKLVILGNDVFYEVELDQTKPDAIYFLYKLREKFRNYKFVINEKFDSADYIIKISNVSIKPVYSESQSIDITGNKLTKREIRYSYDYEILDQRSNQILYSDKISKKTSGYFDSGKKDQIEDSRYTFTQGEMPAESDVNSYVFPAIIVAVSAAAIILFFTIRSN